MNAKTILKSQLIAFLIFAINSLLFSLAFPNIVKAQASHLTNESRATCKLKVNTKSYEFSSNNNGYFLSVTDVKPFATIPIEVLYAKGIAGEKIVLSAEDGGSFDNKKNVMIVTLDTQKKCAFKFQVTNQTGIFEVTLRKGNDTKVIQLWVGEELSAKQDSL